MNFKLFLSLSSDGYGCKMKRKGKGLRVMSAYLFADKHKKLSSCYLEMQPKEDVSVFSCSEIIINLIILLMHNIYFNMLICSY